MEYILIAVAVLVAWIPAVMIVWIQYRTIQDLTGKMLQIAIVQKTESYVEAKDIASESIENIQDRKKKAIKEDEKLMEKLKKDAEKVEKIEEEEDGDWQDGVRPL